ncbi:hypothetical protein P1X15_31905 [Runella sp. MFBS21]|uniref:hypothetical protein n=1 Tax=Runella sp. MFBS21 TaxID=3034018 RepID=UPI0023F9B6C3|nr:hypothetical protein [Runella sp. MFBS21]MDF7822262.1 hypothetical protein [Runella sp. MFBS21]
MKKFLINAIILITLYCNIIGTMSSWKIRFNFLNDLNKGYISNLFYIYGVFLQVQKVNKHYLALGSIYNYERPPLKPNSKMIDLNIKSYFPQSLGEANHRLISPTYYYKSSQGNGYNKMAYLIKNLHLKKDSLSQVKKVFIYVYTWPSDPNGYYTRFNESTIELLGSN